MDTDDLEPPPRKPVKKDLEVMSVGQLEAYIADLEAEIARAREAISHKGTARDHAESFFKKPS